MIRDKRKMMKQATEGWSTSTKPPDPGQMLCICPGIHSAGRPVRGTVDAFSARLREYDNDATAFLLFHQLSYGSLCMLGVLGSFASCSQQPRYAAPPIEGDNVVIQIAPAPFEVPQFYSYRSQGKEINFFVIRLQGQVLTFLDACLSCYPRKLGMHRRTDLSYAARATRPIRLQAGKGPRWMFPDQDRGKAGQRHVCDRRAALDPARKQVLRSPF